MEANAYGRRRCLARFSYGMVFLHSQNTITVIIILQNNKIILL